jgi:hypothetical protein
MKKSILFLSLMMAGSISFSQTENKTNNQRFSLSNHAFGDISISVAPSLLYNTPNVLQFAGGFKLRMFLGKRVSFDTDMAFGRDYIHAGPGLIGIPAWILFVGSFGTQGEDEERPISELLFIAAMMILSAEHTSLHFPVNNSLDVSPYISLLRYKSSYEYGHYSNTGRTNEQLSYAIGLEVNKYFNRFMFSPYVEYNAGYVDHTAGINAGVYCGIYFPNKRQK